jgi:C4-dicarboxylate-specific signal transduction histidine kinase
VSAEPRASGGETLASPERHETHTAIEVLCSELAHEIAPTLTFLRDLVRSRVLVGMDHSIAEEEVARLASILASLRRTKSREDAATEPLGLAAIAARAVERAVRDARGGPGVVVGIPGDLRVMASARGLELLLVSLLRNALAVARRAPVGLRARLDGDAWCLEVVDDGDGLSPALDESLFVPLATLGPAGHGAGIPTVLRIVRDHGWEIAHARRDGNTVFTVRICLSDTSRTGQP